MVVVKEKPATVPAPFAPLPIPASRRLRAVPVAGLFETAETKVMDATMLVIADRCGSANENDTKVDGADLNVPPVPPTFVHVTFVFWLIALKLAKGWIVDCAGVATSMPAARVAPTIPAPNFSLGKYIYLDPSTDRQPIPIIIDSLAERLTRCQPFCCTCEVNHLCGRKTNGVRSLA